MSSKVAWICLWESRSFPGYGVGWEQHGARTHQTRLLCQGRASKEKVKGGKHLQPCWNK